jgi:hypothetical protein
LLPAPFLLTPTNDNLDDEPVPLFFDDLLTEHDGAQA